MTREDKDRIERLLNYAHRMIEIHKDIQVDKHTLCNALDALVERAELIMAGAI